MLKASSGSGVHTLFQIVLSAVDARDQVCVESCYKLPQNYP